MDTVVLVAAISSILAATWRMATPLIYAAIGETLTELSGVLNIGLEGVMLIGAFTGFAVSYTTGSLVIGVLGAAFSGLLCGLLFAFFAVTIKANQIVVGAALVMLGSGLTGMLFRTFFVTQLSIDTHFQTFPPLHISALSNLPWIGEALFQQNIMVYATLLLVPLASFVLYRTAFGLAIRSVGEHPHAADTAGISVTRIRYASICIGAVLTAIGGAYLTLAYANQFVEEIASGRGFIALAVVVFGRWTPKGVFGASLLFGAFYALELRLQAQTNLGIPYQFLQALPYLATVAVLVFLRSRSVGPKALGVPYSH